MKKVQLIVDTESSINNHVIDLGLILLVDGRIKSTKNFLVHPYYLKEELFYNKDKKGAFSKGRLAEKHKFYEELIASGKATIASVAYIQRYFDAILAQYPQAEFLAYNAKFDMELLESSGFVGLAGFKVKCLWQLALSTVCLNKKYARWCLDNDKLTPASCLGTSCDTVLEFLYGKEYTEHNHTALQDCKAELKLYRHLKRLKVRKPLKPFYYKEWKLKEHI